MSYTDSEVTAAIEKLVRTSIRRQQGALGNRDLSLTFDDYMDAAAGVFILFQNSPFYTLYLGVQRLRNVLSGQQEALTEFIETIEATGRYTTKVNNLSPLVNARVALGELERVAGERSSSFENIEESPAFQRFESNTQRFLDESGKNVKSGGQIVRTPDEARGLLAGYYTSLKESVEDIVRRVGLYEAAITDFSSLDLPATLSSSIIANARGVIDSRYDELDALTPKERLGILRDVVLDVLATRSTVRGFGSLTPPTTFLILDGEGSFFADDSHEAEAATILSEEHGPYSILSNNELYFTAEGDGLTVAVQTSFVPFLEGTVYGPYTLNAGGVPLPDFPNNEMRVTLRNHTGPGTSQIIDTTFSTGVLETWDVAEEFNASVESLNPNLPVVMEPYANPLRLTDLVTVSQISPGTLSLTSVNPNQDYTALIKTGDHVIITDPAANNYRAIYKVDTFAALVITVKEVYHPSSYSAETVDVGITIGSDELGLRLRTSDNRDAQVPIGGGSYGARPDHRVDALDERMSIELPDEGFTNYVASVTGDFDLTTLSLPGDITGLSAPVMYVTIDSLASQTVDLTAFVGGTVALLVAAIQAQLQNVVVSETNPGSSPSYIKFTYSGPSDSPSRQVSITSGELLDKLFTGGESGAPYTDLGTTPANMQLNATSNLGFYPGSVVTARKTTAEEIATSINDSASSSLNGVQRVEAAAEFEATLYSGRGRTDPYDWLKVVCSKFEQRGVSCSVVSPLNYYFNIDGAQSAGVLALLPPDSDVMVIRGSTASADIGLVGLITEVSDTHARVTFTQALAGSLTDLDIEIGPLFYATGSDPIRFDGSDFGVQAVITGSPANDGTYNVLSGGDLLAGEVPFELTVDAPMPYSQVGAAIPNTYNVEIGYSKVRFSSLDKTTSTHLFMDDDDGNTQSTYASFFSSTFVEDVGITPFFQLPEWPKNLEEGDILELYFYENAILHSEEFDHRYWPKGGVTITPNTAPGPFAGGLADDLVEDTGTSRHEVALTGIERGEWVLHRCHVQAVNRDIMTIRGNNPWGTAWFDLTAQAVTLSGNWNVPTTQTKLEELDDGWFRCTILRKMSNASGVTVHTVGAAENTSSTSYTGAGNTALRLWGSQVATTKAFNTYTPAKVTSMARSDDPVTNPGFSSPILSLEQTRNLVELTTPLPTDLPSFEFTKDTPYPFARIRKQSLNTYETMREQLEAWLLTDEAQSAYFTELLRLLNPLAVNLNPTAVEVNSAKVQLEDMQAALTTLDGYLAAYEATQVAQIDSLVSTLIEKGADRAVDVLLEGQFSTFFGMDQDELSYAGTVQKGIKEVMRNDLPQRKDNRLGATAADDVSIGEYEEPDFEYDFSDIDDVDEPDIPAGSTFDLS